jgi:hypothetical protein
MKIRPVGNGWFHADGRTDRRRTDMTKLIVVFRTFANAPKNAYVFLASKEAGLEVNAEKRALSSFPVDECSTESQPKDS